MTHKRKKETVKRKRRKPIKTLSTIGKKYGRLFIVKICDDYINYDTHTKMMVVANCDCGKQIETNLYQVTNGKVVSCGCYHKEELSKRQCKPNNESAKRRLYNSYKIGAETRGHSFNLDFETVYEIAKRNCYYCDREPHREMKTVGGKIKVNGIDRVDNSIGYQINNCVPCCKPCNIAKHGVTKEIIIKSYEFFTKL